MFDKFGEFDSVEELNKAAAGLKEEGDTDSIIALAKENGIDEEDALDYIEDCAPDLASLSMAANGRIIVQEKDNPKDDIMTTMALKVIFMMLRGMLCEDAMAIAVMKRGKRVRKIFEAMREEASRNKKGNMGVSCGTDEELRDIIRAYFLNGENAMKERIQSLYK